MAGLTPKENMPMVGGGIKPPTTLGVVKPISYTINVSHSDGRIGHQGQFSIDRDGDHYILSAALASSDHLTPAEQAPLSIIIKTEPSAASAEITAHQMLTLRAWLLLNPNHATPSWSKPAPAEFDSIAKAYDYYYERIREAREALEAAKAATPAPTPAPVPAPMPAPNAAASAAETAPTSAPAPPAAKPVRKPKATTTNPVKPQPGDAELMQGQIPGYSRQYSFAVTAKGEGNSIISIRVPQRPHDYFNKAFFEMHIHLKGVPTPKEAQSIASLGAEFLIRPKLGGWTDPLPRQPEQVIETLENRRKQRRSDIETSQRFAVVEVDAPTPVSISANGALQQRS